MKIKRVVTGRDAAGESVFVSVGDAPRTHDFEHIPGMSLTQLWATPALPTLADSTVDPTATVQSIVPKQGGTQFMVIGFPPDRVMMLPSFDGAAAVAEHQRHTPGLAEKFEPDHPGMHTTDTVDYAVVLRGELSLELDSGRIENLRTGDVVIQNGTRHAWRNPGDEVALVAVVLIGAARKS